MVFNLEVDGDQTYVANGFVVHNCAMCAGMDGIQFALSEELIDHPCGKCSPIPVTKGWGDILGPLGIDASDMADTSMGAEGAYTSFSDRFDSLPAAQQRAIIGTKTGYEAYQRGEVTLKDFIGQRPATSDGWPAQYYQKSLRELQIPTRQSGRLVEPSPELAAKFRAGALKARDLGEKIPLEQMPKWAQKSPASQSAYQILRNGLPYNMTRHEIPMLSMNLEQMLTEDLSLNVREAALRQLDQLKQYDAYLEANVRHVTTGASTLGAPPPFVYRPSSQLARDLAAARQAAADIAARQAAIPPAIISPSP